MRVYVQKEVWLSVNLVEIVCKQMIAFVQKVANCKQLLYNNKSKTVFSQNICFFCILSSFVSEDLQAVFVYRIAQYPKFDPTFMVFFVWEVLFYGRSTVSTNSYVVDRKLLIWYIVPLKYSIYIFCDNINSATYIINIINYYEPLQEQ